MLDIEDVIKKLQDRNLQKIADSVDLHYQTIWRLARGRKTNITSDTLKKLSDYFEKN